METISIGFSKPNKFKLFAWLIQSVYSTPYSHVYIKIYSNKYKRFLYYQASGTAVNFMGEKYFAGHNTIVNEFTVDMTNETYTEMMQWAIDTAGVPYGIVQCFWMAYVRLGEILRLNWKAPTSDNVNTFVCSELASYVLEKFVGVNIPRLPDDMTPKDVYELMLQVSGAINSSASDQNS